MNTTAAALLLKIDAISEVPRRQRNNALQALDAEIAKLPVGLDRAILVARSQEAYDKLIDPFR